MWRWPLRVVSGLLMLHAALGFAIAPKLFPGLTAETLGFAQHGFAFIFLALLNLAAWQEPRRTSGVRIAVHASNLALLAFYVVWCVVKPEAPNYAGAALLLLLTLIAALSDMSSSPVAASPDVIAPA
jgi:hypothetical protein